MNMDLWLFHLLNDFVGTLPPFDWFIRFVVNDYAIPTIISLIAAGLWFAGATEEERIRNQRAVILIALGILFSQALIKDLAAVYFRPRPFATEPVKLLFYRPSVSSFPSIPIAVTFTFAMGAWYANRRIAKILFALGIVYAFARVYAGVHYPSDVIGGAVIGAGMVWIVARLNFAFAPLSDGLIRLARKFYLA